DRLGQPTGIRELAAALAIRSNEIGIAEAASRLRPIFLAPRPQVAAGKTTEHRRAAGLRALALQGLEQLFHAIGHGRYLLLRGRGVNCVSGKSPFRQDIAAGFNTRAAQAPGL